MTAAQTAEQQAAADKAATEQQAAQQSTQPDAATQAATPAKAKTGTTSTAQKPKGLLVVGAAVVLRSDDGSERYLYRGAPVDPAAFSKDSIKHATATGLIARAK